ncbi:tRNA dimethylallyltransferase, mitochondrial [Marasmius tenuissimus]|uniref:tRNA dimethylallyltransferase, mitochondrial n=1 Tax=Marasmius tenuissimus TaxID=585030 RepID=A0ABR2ZKU3_9AGAR
MSFRPLIAICGTTGVGKSNLAIEIALALSSSNSSSWTSAKVINADAMQVYAGMDIITNKVPVAERQGVEHLLMGFKPPTEQYVVGQWVRDALNAVEEAHSRKQVPIIVGGTSYWIQHLLFPDRLARNVASTPEPEDKSRPSPVPMSPELAQSVAALPPDLLSLFNSLPDPAPNADTDPEAAYSLYNLLKSLDLAIAERWHWKDTRKVLRSLRIIEETGKRPSEMIEQQSRNRVKPRFNTLCFWLYAKPDVLKPRLDLRVDKMVEQGLLDEVRALRELTTSNDEANGGSDYTFGMFQSIGKLGYREFHSYLALSNPTDNDFQTALNNMKTSTRQYAKKQISWLRNKLLPALYSSNEDCNAENTAHTYLLDATELGDSWETNVYKPAIQITHGFLSHEVLPNPSSLSETADAMLRIEEKPTDPDAVLAARKKIVCGTCTINPAQPFMVEEGKEWALHVKTRGHRRRAHKKEQANRTHSYRRASENKSSNGDTDSETPEVDLSSGILER